MRTETMRLEDDAVSPFRLDDFRVSTANDDARA
jgi:hypothetical protein